MNFLVIIALEKSFFCSTGASLATKKKKKKLTEVRVVTIRIPCSLFLGVSGEAVVAGESFLEGEAGGEFVWDGGGGEISLVGWTGLSL